MKASFKQFAAIISAVCIIYASSFNLCDMQAEAVYVSNQHDMQVAYDGQVVDSFDGIDAEYVTYPSDTGTFCCATYVSKFYMAKYGVTVYGINMGDYKPYVYLEGHEVELREVDNPRPGDIMQTKTYSHVAIVKAVNGSEITLIEQNYKWDYEDEIYTRVNRKTSTWENFYYRLYIDGVEQNLDLSSCLNNSKVSNISSRGYTVTADLSDFTDVSYVKIGTYTKSAGLDSAKWEVVYNPEQIISQDVKASDFENADDIYLTVIEVCDKFGNVSTKALSAYVNTNPQQISNLQISGVTAKGYTVTCTVPDFKE